MGSEKWAYFPCQQRSRLRSINRFVSHSRRLLLQEAVERGVHLRVLRLVIRLLFLLRILLRVLLRVLTLLRVFLRVLLRVLLRVFFFRAKSFLWMPHTMEEAALLGLWTEAVQGGLRGA